MLHPSSGSWSIPRRESKHTAIGSGIATFVKDDTATAASCNTRRSDCVMLLVGSVSDLFRRRCSFRVSRSPCCLSALVLVYHLIPLPAQVQEVFQEANSEVCHRLLHPRRGPRSRPGFFREVPARPHQGQRQGWTAGRCGHDRQGEGV